jgi:GNAT superfamily N-acetyltransferase
MNRDQSLEAIRLEPVRAELPIGFDILRAEAASEGWKHVERLANDWQSGIMRFDGDGEVLLAAFLDDVLIGVGGLTNDPHVPSALRMRRFYVRPAYRRMGVGRKLATALLERASAIDRAVTVNASGGSGAFWLSLGFADDLRDGHTRVFEMHGYSPVPRNR